MKVLVMFEEKKFATPRLATSERALFASSDLGVGATARDRLGSCSAALPQRLSFERGAENLLTPQQAARLLALSTSWLAKLRLSGDGPPFLKLGRCVRYRRDDLEKWLETKARSSTSDDGNGE